MSERDDELTPDVTASEPESAAKETEAVETEVVETGPAAAGKAPGASRRRRILAFAVLPLLALLLAGAAGWLKWTDTRLRAEQQVADEVTEIAREAALQLLSYEADKVDEQLRSARDRLTGGFRDYYTDLTERVVIPAAKQQRINAVVNVPAAGVVAADPGHATVLLFVDQLVTVGDNAPTSTKSSVRVGLEKVDGHWLISEFQPLA